MDDAGFRRHIPSEQVDRQVLQKMGEMIEGHEDLLSEQAAKMLGQDDIFTRAMIENQFKNMNCQVNRNYFFLFPFGLAITTIGFFRLMLLK